MYFESFKHIKIKEKAIKIAESCETIEHVDSAFNFLQLYLEKTEDFLGYNQIRHILLETEERLKSSN
jgi:hypothetical protein